MILFPPDMHLCSSCSAGRHECTGGCCACGCVDEDMPDEATKRHVRALVENKVRECCKHDLDVTSCADCLYGTRERGSTVVVILTSKSEGRCPRCNETIYQGDRIAVMSNGTDRHIECAL